MPGSNVRYTWRVPLQYRNWEDRPVNSSVSSIRSSLGIGFSVNTGYFCTGKGTFPTADSVNQERAMSPRLLWLPWLKEFKVWPWLLFLAFTFGPDFCWIYLLICGLGCKRTNFLYGERRRHLIIMIILIMVNCGMLITKPVYRDCNSY